MDSSQINLTVVSPGTYQINFTSSIVSYNQATVEYGPDTNYGTVVNARGGNGAYVTGFATPLAAFHYRCSVTDFSTPPVVDASTDQTYGSVPVPVGGGDGDGGDGDGDGDHGDHGKHRGQDKDHDNNGRGDGRGKGGDRD
jgi:hypothetical protein